MTKETNSVLARIMTTAIQKIIKFDKNAVKKLKPLAGKKVKINIQPIDQSVVLLIHENTLEVNTNSDIEVDTTISGKPTALFAMSTNQHIAGLDGVTINGDATTGQFIADFLKQLKPDWEDMWCDLLGEGPGYHVSQIMNHIHQFGTGLVTSLSNSSKEFLTEESRELISPHEMEDFLDCVDDLKSDLVRVERKLARIQDQA